MLPRFFPLSSPQASLFACINWFNSLPHEVKQAVLIYYIIHFNMLTKAKLLLDPSLPTPAFLEHTPINNIITSLFMPDKSVISTPSFNKKFKSSTPGGKFSSSVSQSSSARKFRGSKMKKSELQEVQRLIDWSA